MTAPTFSRPVSRFPPATKSQAMAMGLDGLPPLLRVLLMTDGTVTRILEAYFWEIICVDVFFQGMTTLTASEGALDAEVGDELLVRKVVLRGQTSNRIYATAATYVRLDRTSPVVRDLLVAKGLGIGEVLRNQQVETFREILDVERVPADADAHMLGVNADDTVVRRRYRVFCGGRPFALIQESFANVSTFVTP